MEPDLNFLVVLLQVVRMEEYGLEVTDRKKSRSRLQAKLRNTLFHMGSLEQHLSATGTATTHSLSSSYSSIPLDVVHDGEQLVDVFPPLSPSISTPIGTL